MKSIALALAVGVGCASALGVQQETLRFTEDGTFQISVFSDLHFGEGTDNSTVQLIQVFRSLNLAFVLIASYSLLTI